MAWSQKSVSLSRPDPETLLIEIDSEGLTVPIDRLRQMWDGVRDVDWLLFQFFVRLRQQGVNPRTATAAQMRNAIEGATYWWGA